MTRRLNILLSSLAHEHYWPRVLAVAPHAAAIVLPDGDERVDDLDQIDVAWGTQDLWQRGMIRKMMGTALRAPNLAWMQLNNAGVDDPVFGRLVANGVRLTSAHVNAIPISEYVFHAVLDHLRDAERHRRAQREHLWDNRGTGREIHGSTWTIVGFGAIGREVAVRARAFGATVRGVRRVPRPDDPVDAAFTPDEMTAALDGSDVIVLCAPLDASTHHMANDKFFAACQPGSVLVNVGRGGLVDEDALLRALERGAPAAALLDVTSVEPLPAEHPFWDHPHVVITPHIAGGGRGNDDRLAELFAQNLAAFVYDRPLRHEETEALRAAKA